MAEKPRVRFAPSPTGHLHVGGARTALFNWLFARHHGGTFVLRIEDTDQARNTPEALAGILDALRWLGLDWDEGPEVGGPYGPYFQSQRLPLYRAHADRLVAAGRAYPCYCTPEELEARRQAALARGQPPRYDRRCLTLSPGEAARLAAEAAREGRRPVLRFRAADTGETVVRDGIRGEVRFAADAVDDFVLVKSDGMPTYNFAVVVDDLTMRISHVIRGEEHLSNTPKQLQVYEALGASPPVFAHIPLILAPDRSKLSKRHGAVWVGEFREMGYLPDALVNYLALLGWAYDDRTEVFSRDELIRYFTLDKVQKTGAVFDREKLTWLNGHYLRRLSPDALAAAVVPFLARAGVLPEQPDAATRSRLAAVAAAVQSRLKTLADAEWWMGYFFQEEIRYDPAAVRKFLAREYVPSLFTRLVAGFRELPAWTPEGIERVVSTVQETLGMKLGDILQPVRVAVTGRTVSPGMYEVLALLGRERTCRRLEAAVRVARAAAAAG